MRRQVRSRSWLVSVLAITTLVVLGLVVLARPPAADAQRKKVLNIAAKEPDTLDPHSSTLGQSQAIVRFMFRGLTRFAIKDGKVTTAEVADKYPTYIVVDRSSFTLTLYKDLKVEKQYTVAIGAQGFDTPEGLYSIQNKQVDPVWNVPDSDWAGSLAGQTIPPGPDNPLKARWMGIFDGAGIHGTSDTASLGSAASHGCVRMAVPDVIDLYDRVDVGTPIYIG